MLEALETKKGQTWYKKAKGRQKLKLSFIDGLFSTQWPLYELGKGQKKGGMNATLI